MQLTTQASNTSADNATQDSAEPVTLESLPWNLQLVNKSHYLEDENAIGELKVLPDKSWTDVSRGLQVDSRILESLCSMMDAAQKEGVSPLVCSAYRTFEYQEGLYQRRVQKARDDGYTDAEAEASFWLAPPGASEHHTGLALDIVDASYTNLEVAHGELRPIWLHLTLPNKQKQSHRNRIRAMALSLCRRGDRFHHKGEWSLPRRVACTRIRCRRHLKMPPTSHAGKPALATSPAPCWRSAAIWCRRRVWP